VLNNGSRTGELRLTAASRSQRLNGRELPVCAVLRDDLVVTEVDSGENASKTLTARFPARSTRIEFTTLQGGMEASLRFPFRLEPEWNINNVGAVVFAQDRKSGEIYQSTVVPWTKRLSEQAKGPHGS
jgi:hypothetical protein